MFGKQNTNIMTPIVFGIKRAKNLKQKKLHLNQTRNQEVDTITIPIKQ